MLARAVVVVIASLLPRIAAAQHRHVPEIAADDQHAEHHHDHGAHHPPPRAWWLRASTTVIAGATELLDEARDYQGIGVAAAAGWRRVSGRLALPAYRVSDEGIGLGDALAAAAVDVMPQRAPLRAGVTASLSLPTGDADRGAGMGHPMVAAGGWLRASHGRATVALGGVWARALGEDAEHAAHRRGADGWPLVDPMNPSELMFDLVATAAVAPWVRAGAGVSYAAPIVLMGEHRLVSSAVLELARGSYSLDVQVGVPVIGDPYVARGTIELGYRY